MRAFFAAKDQALPRFDHPMARVGAEDRSVGREGRETVSTVDGKTRTNRTTVVVATSVLLSFISFWRAAAIVLNDLASSAFYAGGIAEQAIGHAAPWFILGVMLFLLCGSSRIY